MTEHTHTWDIYNIVTWIGILIIFFWAVGKSIGWISSPEWVNMLPAYGAVVALAGISAGIGKSLQKLDRVIADVERIEQVVADHSKRIYAVETQLKGM